MGGVNIATAPPRPEYKPLETTDVALATAIKAMTTKDSIAMLANIDRSHLTRYSLILSISEDYVLEFLKTYVIDELLLTCSINGKRSDQITEISKQPALNLSDGNGILSRIRGRFQR